jgi:hypothetical protein
MKSIPWVIGIVMLGLGVAALMFIPRDLPETPGGSAGSGAEPPSRLNRLPEGRIIARTVWNAVEQISPIVGDDKRLTQALGLEIPGGAFRAIVPAGEAAPVIRSFALATTSDDQSEMMVHLCRGNSDRAADNESLGWFRIAGIPAGPAGTTRIGLMLRVADDAIVGAAVTVTGAPLRFYSSPAPTRP